MSLSNTTINELKLALKNSFEQDFINSINNTKIKKIRKLLLNLLITDLKIKTQNQPQYLQQEPLGESAR